MIPPNRCAECGRRTWGYLCDRHVRELELERPAESLRDFRRRLNAQPLRVEVARRSGEALDERRGDD